MENSAKNPASPDAGKESKNAPGQSPDRLNEEGQETRSNGGISGIFDMSDPLKDVYLSILKLGDMTMEEIINEPSFEEKEMLATYVKILARQGYLERYKVNDKVKYRAVLADKSKKSLSDDIWDALS